MSGGVLPVWMMYDEPPDMTATAEVVGELGGADVRIILTNRGARPAWITYVALVSASPTRFRKGRELPVVFHEGTTSVRAGEVRAFVRPAWEVAAALGGRPVTGIVTRLHDGRVGRWTGDSLDRSLTRLAGNQGPLSEATPRDR